jgi:hypothetical protein
MSEHLKFEEHVAAKEMARQADARALESGWKSAAELKRENESFAFPVGMARVDWAVARSVF